jgi:hypothetical protein
MPYRKARNNRYDHAGGKLRIEVQEITGRTAVDSKDGELVFSSVQPALSGDEVVELDFTGVEIFASPFFNASVALIARHLGELDFQQRLKMTHLSTLGQSVAGDSISNALETRNKTDQDRLKELMDMICEES